MESHMLASLFSDEAPVKQASHLIGQAGQARFRVKQTNENRMYFN